MATEWPTVSLGSLVDEIVDRRGVTPLKLGSRFTASGHRVISAKLLKGGQVDLAADEPRFVDDATYRRWMRTPLLADDVILTSEAPLGEVAYLRRGADWCLGQRLFAIRTDKNRLHGRFLYYALQFKDVVNELHSRATGTTAQGIRQSELRLVHVPVPGIDDQRAIAYILGTLDDKIDLNRRLSETLEGIGRALFKSWFVDFDPVRAKAQERDIPVLRSLADLFPSRLVESELREIPEGWVAGTVGTFSTPLSGGTPSKNDSTLWGLDIPWITPKAMNAIHVDDADEYVTTRALGNGTRLAPKGSTLVMVRGMGLHQKVRVSQARRDVTFNQDIKALVPRNIDATLFLFALLDAQERLLRRVESSGHGTGRLPTDLLVAHPITVPQGHLQDRLAAILRSINDRIALVWQDSRTLTALRDGLLPKLVSGEIRVKDAEKFMASAT